MLFLLNPILPKELLDDKTKFFINPTGRFVIGGPSWRRQASPEEK